ncbi:MAG: LapA family protein [Trueperaceae bacterium]|nr:LapA family protein [Trueperaceae bacterium]
MKAVRIIQLILFVIVAIYLILVHQTNNPIQLPWFFPLSPAIVIALGFIIGYLIGLLPGQTSAWRKNRQIAKLEKRIRELEQRVPGYASNSKQPIIPDRVASDELSV